MTKEIMVSIICNAYNHETYIRDALESFVMQKTDFKFEVLVHDDASTDNTADIIREYEKKYPDLIKPIYQTENQYSKGNGMVGKIQLERAKGKYISYCEGDDYWTDPIKLQKQYDALEAHPEVDICAHCGMRVNADTKECLGYVKPADKDCILSMEQVILGGGGYVVTNSLMYRREIIFNEPEFRKFLKLDYTLQMHGSMRGGMLYIAECMSAYRVMSKDSWSARMKKNNQKYIAHLENIHKSLIILNKETNFQYDNVIGQKILENEFFICKLSDDYVVLKSKKYKAIYNKLSLKEKLYINLYIYFPWIIKINDKLKGR